MKNKVSAEDVAKLANVSQSTVSRAFTPNASISEKSKEKVLKASKELNYYPNALARALINNKSGIIGLAIKNVQNPFYFEVLNKISKRLEEEGLSTLYISTENENLVIDDVKKFLEFNVDGIIITDALLDIKNSEVVAQDIPIVLFNRYDAKLPYHSVFSENKIASEKIAEYILSHGIEDDIYYIAGIENTSTNKERKQSFISYLERKKIKTNVIKSDYSYEKTYKLVENLLQKNKYPQAIFAANDIMALGALDALKNHKVRVPEETIIIGYDNIRMASWPSNKLTTWEQPVDEMIDWTLDLLLSNKKYEEPQKISLNGKLIYRETTR